MRSRVQRLIALGPDDVPRQRQTQKRNEETALLTVEEFASRVGVGKTTVYQWRAAGTIASVPLGVTGRVRRIPAGEVERMRNHGRGEGIPS